MAELNEYQINQITTNIKQFSETYKELTYKISKSNLDRKFDKAVSNLKTYINDTKKAIQDAEKAFKIAIEGERSFFGLLSTNGLNGIINKKFSESSEVINKIIKENDDNIENIINSLPTIGKATNISGIYNSTEYAGDEDYSNNSIFDSVSESVSRTGGSSSLGFAFFNDDFNEYNEDYSLDKENINETNYSSNEIFVTQGPTLVKCNSNDESIKIDENISIFSVGCFQNLISLKKIEFEKATELKMNLFSGCSNLKLIILPENVEIISPNAFRNIPDDCVICFKGEKDKIQAYKAIEGKKVIFGYKSGDEEDNGKIEEINFEKKSSEKAKRIVIKKDTPLDSDEMIDLWMKRNSKYKFSLNDVKQAISNIGNNTDKDAILKEALIINIEKNLEGKKFFDFASNLHYLIKIQKENNEVESCIESIFGLMYLDTSGYRMYDIKYSPYIDYEHNCYYHPSMELKELNELIEEGKINNDSELDDKYRKSKYVIRLSQILEKPLYSVEASIQLMHLALKNPYEYFNPHTSGVIKNYK